MINRTVHAIVTVVSIAALFTAALLLPFRVSAASASLYLSPSTKSVNVDDSFSVVLYVSTDAAINAAEATITFPTDKLRVTGVSKSGIFTLWAQDPSYSNSTGRVTFSGGLPSPGYKGKAGKILTIRFKAKAEGKAQVAITNGQVLANDGKGTNILKSQGTGTYTITKAVTPPPPPPPPPVLSSPTIDSSSQPDPAKWYNVNDVTASWQGGTGVKGYSVVFDQTAGTVPAEKSSGLESKFSRDDVADGVWYLHVRAQYDGGWSSTTHFKYQIDVTPPQPFTISITGDPEVAFDTSDATSGVDHYELSLDDGPFATVTSPYQTPELQPGKHTVKVKAFDKAGNVTEASTEFEVVGYPQPIIIDLTPVIFGDEPLIIRGLSNAQDSIRLTIDDKDYGPFPVSDNVDKQPPKPPPEGQAAWRLEVNPNVGPGEHEITLSAIGPDGRVSSETPAIKFRIVTNAVRLFGMIIPTILIINLLIIILVLMVLIATYFAIRYYRLRRHVNQNRMNLNILKPSNGQTHDMNGGQDTEVDHTH